MIVFVIGIVVAIAAIPTCIAIKNVNKHYEEQTSCAWSLIPLALGLILIGSQCFYAQDIGEAAILKNFGGSIAGTTTEAGLHLKAPWQDVTNWDIRNRLINFYKTSEYSYETPLVPVPTLTFRPFIPLTRLRSLTFMRIMALKRLSFPTMLHSRFDLPLVMLPVSIRPLIFSQIRKSMLLPSTSLLLDFARAAVW